MAPFILWGKHMPFYGRSTGGGWELDPSYNMSNALSCISTIEDPEHSWQEDYWRSTTRLAGERPFPIMANDRPYWRGVWPTPRMKDTAGKAYIAGFDLKCFEVPEKCIRLPTNLEYDKYFRAAVEGGLYLLVAKGYGYVLDFSRGRYLPRRGTGRKPGRKLGCKNVKKMDDYRK